jgi:hypothetical protein
MRRWGEGDRSALTRGLARSTGGDGTAAAQQEEQFIFFPRWRRRRADGRVSHHATIIGRTETGPVRRNRGTANANRRDDDEATRGGCRWSVVEGRRGPHKSLRSAACTWWCAHEAATRKSSQQMTLRFVLREHRIFDGKFLSCGRLLGVAKVQKKVG